MALVGATEAKSWPVISYAFRRLTALQQASLTPALPSQEFGAVQRFSPTRAIDEPGRTLLSREWHGSPIQQDRAALARSSAPNASVEARCARALQFLIFCKWILAIVLAKLLRPAAKGQRMKGVVFNLLEEAVTREFGEDAWEHLLDDTGLPGIYTSLGNYSDEEIEALVCAAAKRLSMSPAGVLQWFGQRAMPLLKERYPALFANHPSSRNFILSVNSIIHPEVRKLYAGAACPFFHFREAADGGLTMKYESSRKLFDLAHGFVLGAASLWNETVTIVRGPAGTSAADTMVIRWV